MRINLRKTVFTRKETDFIIDRLKQAAERGYLASRSEKNIYLKASFKGVEGRGIPHQIKTGWGALGGQSSSGIDWRGG